MKKFSNLIIFVFVFFIVIINIDKVFAAEFGSIGNSNIGNFDACGEYNGCIGTVGYRYTIITNFGYSENSVSYNAISGSYLDKNYINDPTQMASEIKEGGWLFNRILTGTGVSSSTFFDNNYLILMEPWFKIMYDGTKSFDGVAVDTAYHILELINWNESNLNNIYKGFWSVNQLIPCTAYISFSGSSSDSFCIETAKDAHKMDYLKIAANNTRYGKWVIYAKDIKRVDNPSPRGSISITKTDPDKTGATKGIQGIRFYLEQDSTKSCTTNYYGKCTITNIPYGTYTLVEDRSSANKKGYNGIYSTTVVINDNSSMVSISAENKKSCTAEFELYKNDRKERIRMYNYYKGKGFNYRNLLDFTNTTDAAKACSKKETCDNSINMGCLSASSIDKGFNQNNLSCYNDIVTIGGYIGYCGVSLSLGNNLNGYDKDEFEYTLSYTFPKTKSGQMLINRGISQKLVAQGVITKKCYVYGLSSTSVSVMDLTPSGTYDSYSDYVKGVYLNFDNGEKIDNKIEPTESWWRDKYSEKWTASSIAGEMGTLFEKKYYQDYSLRSVYSDIGTGKINYNKCDSKTNKCKLLGYGFASPLSTVGDNLSLYFSLDVNEVLNSSRKTLESNACKYSVNNEIIDKPGDPKGDLNVEFRIIDTTNPFPGKDGNGRNVGENWCSIDMDYDEDKYLSPMDLIELDRVIKAGGEIDKKYDVNRDGKVDEKDSEFMRKVLVSEGQRPGKDCRSNNSFASVIMNMTNNSYDKNGTGAKYTITLNSSSIKAIQEYNKENSYDDYNLKCDENGENCKSEFLSGLLIGRVDGKGIGSKLVVKE